MNFEQDYTDLRCIHILLLGVEMIPESRLDYYKSIFSHSSIVNVSSLNLSRETSDGLNSIIAISTEEELNLKFITSDIGSSKFPMQTHKTIFAIYGIGEAVSDIMAAYHFVEETSKSHLNAVIWKLFCFEPKLEDNIFEEQAPNLILFHPNTSLEKLHMNVGIVLNDLSSMILTGLVATMQDYCAKDCIFTQGETDYTKVRRRKQGRYTKMLGDVALLLGNFTESSKRYEESLDKYKSQVDWVWIAAILESLACISCYAGNYDQAATRFTEAENNYLKAHNGKLNIECQFKFARFMIQSGKKVKAIKKLARLLDSNIEGTDQNDRTLVAKYLGILCKEIGFERKAGFFMRLAASGCVDLGKFGEAHDLLQVSAKAYQISEEKFIPAEKTREFDRDLYIVRENLMPWARGDFAGWRILRKITLEHLKAIAKKIGDTDSSVKYTWNLLLHSIMEPDFQDQLRIEIEQDAIHLKSNNNFRSPIQLLSLTPLENKLEVAIHDSDNIFLHVPWLKKKLNWIKGSVHSVIAVIQHKLSFTLHIEQTKLIIEGAAECLPTEKKISPKVKETLEYLIVPKCHGKLIIKGIRLQTMGLESCVYINPIELEIMQSLPELDISLNIPGCSCDQVPPQVVMLTSEQLEIYVMIKNISNEALGKFSIDCSPDIAIFNQNDVQFLQTLKENSEYNLQVSLSAYNKNADVKFSINYSNSEGRISLNTVLTFKMIVNEGVEVIETKIEPIFEYPWQKSLRDINPSMTEKSYTFSKRAEDLGFNDCAFCLVKLRLLNKSKDHILIKGHIKDGNEVREVVIKPQRESVIELMVNRVPNPTEKYLNDNIFLEWNSTANKRRGDLTNFKVNPAELIFARESRTVIHMQIEPEGSLYCCNVMFTSQDQLKGRYLYFYPLKVTQDSFKLIPHDLVLSGCLSLAIQDQTETYKLKFLPTGSGEFCLVLGIGSKNSVNLWSYRLWKLFSS